MERLEDGPIVVQLREGSVERHEEGIVDTRVADIVAKRRDQESKCVKGLEHCRHGIIRCSLGVSGDLIRRKQADLQKKVKDRLKNVDNVSKVVIQDEIVISPPRSHDEDGQVI